MNRPSGTFAPIDTPALSMAAVARFARFVVFSMGGGPILAERSYGE
jgi:hypothetical protein